MLINITKMAFGISGGQTDNGWHEDAGGHSLQKFLTHLKGNPRYSVAAWPAPIHLRGMDATDEATAESDAWIGFLHENIKKINVVEKTIPAWYERGCWGI